MPELTDSNDLKQKILDEARSRILVTPGEDEYTTNTLSKDMGCNWQQADKILKSMLEEGLVTIRENGIEIGRACNVYKSI